MESDENTFSEFIHSEVSPVLTKFVIPIYQNDKRGRPSLHGSGFLVRSGGHYFLVSAAHVFETLQTNSLFYYVSPSKKRKLSGQLLVNHWNENRENDPIDVGVLKLSGEGLPPYPEADKDAIDISYLQPSFLHRSKKRYIIIGFPASKSQVNPREYEVAVTAYGYHNDSIEDVDYREYGLAPETHVALRLNLEVVFDSRGNHRNFPKPQGMSGSPIWFLCHQEEKYDGPDLAIVAIGTKYKKRERLLVGTDAAEIIKMIKTNI